MNRSRLIGPLGVGAAVLAAAFLLFGSLPGGRRPADGKVHLRYWYVAGAQDAVPYHARRFNEIQDSIVVEATPIPWQEHEKKILTAVLSGDPPDVVSQFIPVVKWASRMALRPLDGFLAESGFDSTVFFPALWEEMRWEGRTFALPVNSASYAFFYNRRLFREAGLDPRRPPRTWDDVRRYAERLTRTDARGRYAQVGFVPDYGNLHASTLMAWQLDARFVDTSGAHVTLDGPETVQALQWTVDYYRAFDPDRMKAFVAGQGTGDQHGFLSGRLAMAVLDMSFLDQIERFRPDLDFGVATIPTFEGRETASSAGSWWLAIPRGAKHPAAAWAFMRYAVGKQAQLEEVEHTVDDLFPANRLAAHDPAFLTDSVRAVFVRQMDHARSPAVVPMAHDVFWREFYGAQERAVSGRQTAAAALRQAGAVVQAALDRALAYDRYVRAEMRFDE